MIKLPKTKTNPKDTKDFCKCRPVCKSRRREWKGHVQNTSAELLLERKPLPECFRRWPTEVYPNGPCPLFGRTRRITVNQRDAVHEPRVVRICQAPVDVTVDTPYLRYAEMAKKNGAWGAVRLPREAREYVPQDAERHERRRLDMQQFDKRVRTEGLLMRIMYHET